MPGPGGPSSHSSLSQHPRCCHDYVILPSIIFTQSPSPLTLRQALCARKKEKFPSLCKHVPKAPFLMKDDIVCGSAGPTGARLPGLKSQLCCLCPLALAHPLTSLCLSLPICRVRLCLAPPPRVVMRSQSVSLGREPGSSRYVLSKSQLL